MDNQTGRVDFSRLYHSSPVGLLSYWLEGDIFNANACLLELLGLDERTLHTRSFTSFLNSGGKLYYNLFVLPILQLSKEVREISLEIIVRGKAIPCLFSARVEKDTKDNIVVHASILHVADRRKYEQELLTRKKRAEEDGLRKDQALNEVAFYQSHLVRAPLANIIALTRLLSAHHLGEDERSLVRLLEQSATQLDDVVKKIVTRARIEE